MPLPCFCSEVLTAVNTVLYVLAGYDDKTETYLSGMQKKLYDQGFSGRHTKNIPMHISLGCFPCEKENELKTLLHSKAQEISASEVGFSHIGLFPGGEVLFAAPDANKELLALKEIFCGDTDLTPHTTLLIDDPDSILKALPAVMEDFSPFRGKITSLHLYEFFPARHILTVPLKDV